MDPSPFKKELAGPVAIVTLGVPERRNPLSLATMRSLAAALHEIGNDDRSRVVILAAEGPVFSAGHDLREMTCGAGDETQYAEVFDACTELMETVQRIPQPVIAEVDGVATAAGCQLVATCDLAVASEQARFATPGVKIGLFCSTPMVALTRAIGRKRAMEMLLTGRMIDAATAAEWGLVNRVVARDRLRPETLELAGEIAAASPLTVGVGKQAFYRQIEMPQPSAYEYAQGVMSANAAAHDAQEGMTAFLEKRKPRWKGE